MVPTGEPDGPLTRFGLPMVDLGAAEYGYGEALGHDARRLAIAAGAG